MEVPYKMAYKIQLRRGTATQWQGLNPVLSAGEPGVELDTGKFKIGNGLTTWNELDYAAGDTPTGEFAPLLHTHTANQITDAGNLFEPVNFGPFDTQYQETFFIESSRWTNTTLPNDEIVKVLFITEIPERTFLVNRDQLTVDIINFDYSEADLDVAVLGDGTVGLYYYGSTTPPSSSIKIIATRYPRKYKLVTFTVDNSGWTGGGVQVGSLWTKTLQTNLSYQGDTIVANTAFDSTSNTTGLNVYISFFTNNSDLVISYTDFNNPNQSPLTQFEVSVFLPLEGNIGDAKVVTSISGKTGDVEIGLNDLTDVQLPFITTVPLPLGEVLKTTSNDNIFRPGHPLITSTLGEIQNYNFTVNPSQWQWDSLNNYWYVDLTIGNFSNTTYSIQFSSVGPSLPDGQNVILFNNAIRLTTFAPEFSSPPVTFDVFVDVTLFKFPATQYNGVVAVNGQSGYVNIQNGYSQAQIFENSVFIETNNGNYQAPSNLFLSQGEYVIDVIVKNLGINNGELSLDIQGPNGNQFINIPQNNYAFKSYTYFVPIGQNHQVTFTFEKFNGNGLSSNVEFTVKTLKKEFTTT
jgi:hypothetical protein